MAKLDLNQLSKMLNDYFETKPPTDAPDHVVQDEVRLVGNPVSLGDGKDPESVRGLENVVVFVKRKENDLYEDIRMDSWMRKEIEKGQRPEQIADKVNDLLDNGLLLHYEQGRKFPTRLVRNLDTGKMQNAGTHTSIKMQPTPKPKLNVFQKIAKAFGFFRGRKAVEYDTWMRESSIDSYTERQGAYRESQSKFRGGNPDHSQGLFLANEPSTLQALQKNNDALLKITNAARVSHTPIFALKQTLKEAALEQDLANAREATKLFDSRLTAQQKEAATQAVVERNWTPLQDREIRQRRRDQKIIQQDQLFGLGTAKDMVQTTTVSGNTTAALSEEIFKGIAAAMDPKNEFFTAENQAQLKDSLAMKRLCHCQVSELRDMIKNNEIIDRFAHIVMTEPGAFSKVKLDKDQSKLAMQNLCDHCIDPPARLKDLVREIEKEQDEVKQAKTRPQKAKTQPEKAKTQPEKAKTEPEKAKTAPAKSSQGMGK